LVAKSHQKSFCGKNITFPRESENGQNSKRGKALVQTKDKATLLPVAGFREGSAEVGRKRTKKKGLASLR
jgi:hypothetical protein